MGGQTRRFSLLATFIAGSVVLIYVINRLWGGKLAGSPSSPEPKLP